MELADMNSLGLFDLNILSVQVGPTLYSNKIHFTLAIVYIARTLYKISSILYE